MNRKSAPPIPEAIVQLQRQLDQFRSTRPRRTKLREPLWQAAVELARLHGIYPVAHPLWLDYMGLKKTLGGNSPPLRLDYMGLKKRLAQSPPPRRKTPKPVFVDLTAPDATSPHECAIDFECP